MISREQLAQRRQQAVDAQKAVAPTSITIDGQGPFAAARWSGTSSAENALAALEGMSAISFLIERALIAALNLREKVSVITEVGGKSYKLDRVRDANPACPNVQLDCINI